MSNIFDAIPEDLSTEFFDTLLKSNNVKIERIVSKGQSSPETGWYDQAENEWVMVLKGAALLTFADNSPVTLKRGDYLEIKAHQKHRVTWTDPEIETVWLAIHYK